MIFIAIGTIVMTLLSCLLYKAHLNTRQAAVNRVEINAGRERPGSSFNVLHISDMHLEHISVTPEQLYEQLKEEKIDLIALTGDYLDRKRSIPKLVPYLQVFNQLQPTCGIFAVFGNHDYVLKDESFAALKETLERNGCRTLRNENAFFVKDGASINVIGIDDYSTNRSNIAASYKGVKEGYRLVLTHDPNIVLAMRKVHYDYLLSGHFHGGQIHWPKPYHLAKMGKLVGMNMIKGLHVYDGKPFYISEGLGQTGVNIRMGSRPEITLHRLPLHSAASKAEQQKTLAAI
ncbi:MULTISPECIES: metallophosphoesterase [unclassified Paenibacillus]|uniref:metallophosphoesterase n=1 Tax=unclassified Paenibacillus TaxID=185978 RepID=UPI001C0FFED5|nr:MULTISPECIES: metallophosphoesterase [unclassified Paenibacillus]MBU5443236.1 metallophosphoesterase [Paenibacillus sp. MSJ-34]CAH0121954.1 hypothetical protein PAE9249_04490 [Paenibacillus sp. CECT 9249]